MAVVSIGASSFSSAASPLNPVNISVLSPATAAAAFLAAGTQRRVKGLPPHRRLCG